MVKVFKPLPVSVKQSADISADLSATFVKWFIPTFGVLFTLIGYAVHTAHLSLLGFPIGDSAGVSVSTYSAEAADFLRHIATLIGDRLFALGTLQSVSLGGHGILLLGCATAALITLGYRFSSAGQSAPKFSAGLLGLTVVALIATKFIWFDAPTMRVESVIAVAGLAELIQLKGQDSPPTFASRLSNKSRGGLDSVIATRTSNLWKLLVCGRLSSASLAENPDFSKDGACSGSVELNQVMLKGEFDATAVLGIFIGVTSAVLLGVRKPLALACAVLGLTYLLTIPYAYGKLIKSVEFPFALVRFSPVTPHNGRGPDTANAFVVARGAGEVTLLEAVPEFCSVGQRVTLRFWSLPTSRLIAIEQISSQDVITWAMGNARRCSSLKNGPLDPARL